MENKCLKTSVRVNDTVFSTTAEQAIDVDFTLPDYCNDISKIFKCQAVPRIASKGINGKTITIEGSVAITIIYCDDDGILSSYEYQYPFSKSIEASKDLDGADLCCKTRIDYINCRAVTGRKVDIHGAAGIFIKATKRKNCEVVSDYDDSNIELRRGVAPATVPMGYSEKYLLVEDEIRAGAGQPPIKCIIRSDAVACVKETKIINDKAVVKGEITVCLIYCPEGGAALQSVKSVIPFSQIVEVDGITDSCTCDTKADIAYCEIKPKLQNSNECKSFSLTAKLLLTVEAYCSNEIAVVLDAFSRKFESDIKRNKVCFENIVHNVSEIYHTKKTVELDESIASVVDLWSGVGSFTTKFDKCEMIISGTLIAGMIICNDNNNSLYCEKPVEFEYRYPVVCTGGVLHSEPQLEVVSCAYTITSANNIELRIDLKINAAVYERNDILLISEMEIDKNRPMMAKNSSAMTVYFANQKECIWDIARIYNASVEEIMKINGLDSDELTTARMLLVPVM